MGLINVKWKGSSLKQDASNRLVTDSEKTTWNNKANSNHSHDDRYYTETEINDKLQYTYDLKLSGVIPTDGDLNKYTVPGIYGQISGTIAKTIKNLPYSSESYEFKLIVEYFFNDSDNYILQRLYRWNSCEFYIRESEDGGSTWASWKKFIRNVDIPTSLPASDVYSWAKSSTKPSYTKSEVGLGNVDNTSDANKNVNMATKLQTYKSGSTSETYGNLYPLYAQWNTSNQVLLKVDNYKVNVDNANTVNNHTVEKDVPSNAVFTDTWRQLGTTADTACAGNDSRLSNSRPASDVYSWAKAASKPSYSWSEINDKPTMYQLKTFETIPANSDLNKYIIPGTYGQSQTNIASTIKNLPYGSIPWEFKLIVEYFFSGLSTYIIQKLTRWNSCICYIRESQDGGSTWKAWHQIPQTSGYVAKLQTYKSGSTTETYESSYLLYAQWNTSNQVALKCDGYSVITDYSTNSGKVNGHTVSVDVPSGAKFTDTWRGIQNNLTSDSTTDSLSAAQGKVLKGLVDGKAASSHTHNTVQDINNSENVTFAYSKAGMNYGDYTWLAAWNGQELRAVTKGQFATSSHTHTKSQITDFPTSLPASDVYAWAKASTKPSYSWSEITSRPEINKPEGSLGVNGITFNRQVDENLLFNYSIATSDIIPIGTTSYNIGTSSYKYNYIYCKTLNCEYLYDINSIGYSMKPAEYVYSKNFVCRLTYSGISNGTSPVEMIKLSAISSGTASGVASLKLYRIINSSTNIANTIQPYNGSSKVSVTSYLPSSTGTLQVASSDIKLKENINECEIDDAISFINKIQLHSFDWKTDGYHQPIGFIADELKELDSNLSVGGNSDELDENGLPIDPKCVNTFYLQGYEVKAIQELSNKVDTLEKENNELKDIINQLLERVTTLENK